ncbi:MAG: DJ-1/PfpI family protein [Actinobacteria bacterium]|nr:DJ-1/PfpI family protein [Actinomycetota bacterium]
MDIVFLIFDRFTALDAVGPYEVLSRLPGASVTFCAARAGPVRNDSQSLGLVADAAMADVEAADILVVPGGPGTRELMGDAAVHDWVRAIHATTRWTTSVCTGSLILGGAGLLNGVRATGHWMAREELGRLGATVVEERVVREGKLVTAAGVSAGIDMALCLAGWESGEEVAQAIQLLIEYDPQPPYQAGSPDKAPAEIVGRFTGRG